MNIFELGGGLTLPDQDFFVPNIEFADWLASQHWLKFRRVIDAGAGRGRFGRALLDRGLEVVSIDHNTRATTVSPVEIENAVTFNYLSDDVVFICRPCHSGWHLAAYKRAIHYGVLDCLYIGLEKNLEADFGDDWELELLHHAAGEDGEKCWRVIGQKSKLKVFARTTAYGFGELKYVDGEARLVNSMGGYCPVNIEAITSTRSLLEVDQLHSDPESFAHRSKAASEAAHRSDPIMGRQTGMYGWVGPNGEWYPCGSRDHDEMLRWCFHIDNRRASKLGFVKAYGTFFSRLDDKRVNAAQAKTLREQGYTLENWQLPEERSVETLSVEEKRRFTAATFKRRNQLDGD